MMQDMRPLQRQTLAQGVKTFVPPNYALSFDIIPTGLVSVSSSIIHYTQDRSDKGRKGRIPGRLQFVQPISLTYKSIIV